MSHSSQLYVCALFLYVLTTLTVNSESGLWIMALNYILTENLMKRINYRGRSTDYQYDSQFQVPETL